MMSSRQVRNLRGAKMMNQRDHDGTEQAVEPTRSSRRGFVRTAALGAAGLAAEAALRAGAGYVRLSVPGGSPVLAPVELSLIHI